jgi:hypothetical protein
MKKRLFVLIFLSIFQSGCRNKSAENKTKDLELSIHCPDKKILVGDEIPVVFTITNRSDQIYQYDKRNHDRSGRLLEYKLQAKDEKGNIVTDPRENVIFGLGGGLSGGTSYVAKGQSFCYEVALNRWVLIKNSGTYTVTGTYSYDVPRDPDSYPDTGINLSDTIEVKSKPIKIKVKSRSNRQMGNYIANLQKQLRTTQSSNTRDMLDKRKEIILKLLYTCDGRIIPTLIDLIYSNLNNNDVFWAMEGFRCYLPKTAKIKDQLINVVQQRGLGNGMHSILEAYNCDESIFTEAIVKSLQSQNLDIIAEAALAAHDHPSDEIMAGLIAVAKGTLHPGLNTHAGGNARHRAIYSIANSRTDEGVEALKALLNDSDEEIRNATKEAVRRAYQRHPKYPERTDDEYTAILIPIAKDPNHPEQILCVNGILRTRTKEGVEAIKNLLKNPDVDIPLVKTDSGVRAIRDILKHSESERRNMIADYISAIYRDYPGRALRDDDFPEEFREDLNEYKKKILERVGSWQN